MLDKMKLIEWTFETSMQSVRGIIGQQDHAVRGKSKTHFKKQRENTEHLFKRITTKKILTNVADLSQAPVV